MEAATEGRVVEAILACDELIFTGTFLQPGSRGYIGIMENKMETTI